MEEVRGGRSNCQAAAVSGRCASAHPQVPRVVESPVGSCATVGTKSSSSHLSLRCLGAKEISTK